MGSSGGEPSPSWLFIEEPSPFDYSLVEKDFKGGGPSAYDYPWVEKDFKERGAKSLSSLNSHERKTNPTEMLPKPTEKGPGRAEGRLTSEASRPSALPGPFPVGSFVACPLTHRLGPTLRGLMLI